MAGTNAGMMAFEGGDDPRLDEKVPVSGTNDYVRPQYRALHDPTISFEEFHYYAKLTRAAEDERLLSAGAEKKGILKIIFPPKSRNSVDPKSATVASEKHARATASSDEDSSGSGRVRAEITDEEWVNASRAMRTATWAAVFYLITTDILGPYGVPYAIGTMGWGPGVGMYTAFGIMAGFSGWLIYNMFLGLDSDQYPMKTYGDIAFRIYGNWCRHAFNFLQSVQLLCNVGVIIVGNGQALSQVTKFHLCYAVCCLIFALLGFGLGQIRTLQKFGWLANAAVWINLLTIFITMGVAAHTAPNYTAGQAAGSGASILDGVLVTPDQQGNYPPIKHFGGLPDQSDFVGAVTGLMQGVYAYGGAMLL
ncbi:MAG: hypothetical protein Q9227_002532 [Pyrenula ochraceoflavens]